MARKKAEKSLDELLKEALVKEGEEPYEVPGNWVWVKIGNVIEEVEKIDPKKEGVDKFTYLDISSINNITGKIANPKICQGYKAPSRARQVVKVNDILFSTVRHYLKNIAVVDEIYNDQIASTGFCVLRSDGIIDSNLLFQFVRSDIFVDRLNGFQRGISYPAVKTSDLLKQPVPLSPLPEQERIVKNLSSMLAKLKEARELIQEARDTFEERRAAILNKAFTGELTKKWREENPDVESAERLIEILITEKKNLRKEGKKEKIPTYEEMIIEKSEQPYKIPWNWEFVRLGKVVQTNPPKYKPEICDDTLCSFVPMKAVSDKLGIIENIEENPFGKIKNGYTSFKENDVLFAKITPCMENGKAAIAKNLINGFGYGSTEFFVFRCSTIVDNNFLYYLVRSKFFRDLAEPNMTGTVGQRRVPKNYLNNFKFPLPPLEEQKEIVRILEKLLNREDEARALIDMEEQIDLLEKSILSKAFRGELGTNDIDDEPAIELLKRSLTEKM